jgi:2-keto-4-pentenoate hydratase
VNTQYWLRKGRRLIGRKIGLTSKAVQKQLGVDQPDYGMLYADMVMCDGEEVPLARVMQPKVEAEVALVLEKDLKKKDIAISELISAVAYAVPAIEIVGSRIANWNIKSRTPSRTMHRAGSCRRRSQEARGLDLRLAAWSWSAAAAVSLGAGVACLVAR